MCGAVGTWSFHCGETAILRHADRLARIRLIGRIGPISPIGRTPPARQSIECIAAYDTVTARDLAVWGLDVARRGDLGSGIPFSGHNLSNNVHAAV